MPLTIRHLLHDSDRKDAQISNTFNVINNQDEYRDLEFICGEEKLRYHKAMIIPHSSLLTNLVNLHNCCQGYGGNNRDISISLDDVDARIVEIVMNCLYTRTSSVFPLEMLEDVEKLKNVLGIKSLLIEDEFGLKDENDEKSCLEDMEFVDEFAKQSDEELSQFSCKTCKMSFNLSIKLKKHMKIHNMEESLNDLYDEQFLSVTKDKNSVEIGQFSKGPSEFACEICKVTFNLSIKLKKHMSIHKNDSDDNFYESLSLKINKIKTEIDDPANQSPISDSPVNEILEQMGKITTLNNELTNSDQNNDVSSVKKNIDSILKNNYKILITKYKPDETDESVPIHKGSKKIMKPKKETGSGVFCQICTNSKDHVSRGRLLLHLSETHFLGDLKQKFMKISTGKDIVCEICQMTQTKNGYMRHIGARHEKVLEFLPQDMMDLVNSLPVKKVTARKLEENVVTIGDTENSCNTCGKSFMTKQTLQEHIKTHTLKEHIKSLGFSW